MAHWQLLLHYVSKLYTLHAYILHRGRERERERGRAKSFLLNGDGKFSDLVCVCVCVCVCVRARVFSSHEFRMGYDWCHSRPGGLLHVAP